VVAAGRLDPGLAADLGPELLSPGRRAAPQASAEPGLSVLIGGLGQHPIAMFAGWSALILLAASPELPLDACPGTAAG
jgi:hypothetical protein